MVVLIPAYKPSTALLEVVRELHARRPVLDVVVVDDGSGPAWDDVFAGVAAAGAQVLRLSTNNGKGVALKRGFAHVRHHLPGSPVVCADADGQHRAEDIITVLDHVSAADVDGRTMVLGVRALDAGVPARSRIGNGVTRALFGVATGRRVCDTQTGLRGYPAELLPWLEAVEGERYEYELNLLLAATRDGVSWHTVPIRTIYLDHNASSHFRPIRDSLRVYLPLLAFIASSMTGFLVDTAALLVLQRLTGSLVASVVGARALSASVTFACNRSVVFRSRARGARSTQARRYAALALGLLLANYLLLRLLLGLGAPLLGAKVATELTLFVVSWTVQRRVVFAQPSDPSRTRAVDRKPTATAHDPDRPDLLNGANPLATLESTSCPPMSCTSPTSSRSPSSSSGCSCPGTADPNWWSPSW